MMELPEDDRYDIRDVWAHNLEAEFSLIRNIVDEYPYIAMDTEFPGTVLGRVGEYKNTNVKDYLTLKDNVDRLKLIQLGLAFSDENGNLPTCGGDRFCVWQFNFREFNINEDICVPASVELLRQSGINFEKNNEMGINCMQFSELLMSSGAVLNEDVHWVTFHGSYDFGYLLKLLTWRFLPGTVAGFFEMMNIFFPIFYDVERMMRCCNGLYGGLNKLATQLGIQRIGNSHQAGSDCLLTLAAFMKLKDVYFNGSPKCAGLLYGLDNETD